MLIKLIFPSYLLINCSKIKIPLHIKSNMKILFFEPIDFKKCDEYFTFSISTSNFNINNNQTLNIQNINIDKDLFKKSITELLIGKIELEVFDQIRRANNLNIVSIHEERYSDEIYKNILQSHYYYLCDDLVNFFNLNFLSLVTSTKTIIVSYNNIKNFKYHNNEKDNNSYNLYLTKCNDITYKIQIPFSLIKFYKYDTKILWHPAHAPDKKYSNNSVVVFNKTNEEKYDMFKNKLYEIFRNNTNYVVINISENSDSDYEDEDEILNEKLNKQKINKYIKELKNINESLKTNIQILNNKCYLLQKNIDEIKNENEKKIDHKNKEDNYPNQIYLAYWKGVKWQYKVKQYELYPNIKDNKIFDKNRVWSEADNDELAEILHNRYKKS